jgi:perosamine synthetase
LGIREGDEVILPDLTFVATANAVKYTGAKPVLVDSEKTTWNLNPALIEERITPRTKAIIAVHLYGHPAKMDEILSISRKHNLFLIEDACEAHGALFKGKKIGSIGDIGVFSFYGNKIITTGEGGMIVTNNRKIYDRVKLLRDHAMSRSKKYFHSEVGFNYRLTNIQAAIGLAQLENIEHIIKRKIEIAHIYNKKLEDLEEIDLPPEEAWAKNVYWMYSILVKEQERNRLIKGLSSIGIETRPFFIPMHRLPPYRTIKRFPVSDKLSKCGINLPCFVEITPKQINYICDKVKELLIKK